MARTEANLSGGSFESEGSVGSCIETVAGFTFRVSPTGSKSSAVSAFQLDGEQHDMGLGPFPDVPLAAARAKALATANSVVMESTRSTAKAAQRQAQQPVSAAKGRTFREIAEEFIGRNEAGWRNAKHGQQWRNTLATYVYPALGELSVSAIDNGLVVQVLDPIWTEKPETASRVQDDRGGVGCRDRARLSPGAKPGAMERQPRSYLAGTLKAAEDYASCCTAIRRDARHSWTDFVSGKGWRRGRSNS